MSRLYISVPGGRTGIFELTKAVVTIGRGSANDLVLHSEKVSRFHALLRAVGDEHSIADRNSTNGVLHNGQPIADEATLRDGDVIAIGDCTLRYEREAAEVHIELAEIPSTVENVLRGATEFQRPAVAAEANDSTVHRALERLEHENYLLRVLYDAGKALQSRHVIADIIDGIVELTFRIPGVERGMVMLLDEHGEISSESDVRYRAGAVGEQPSIIFSRAVLERMKREMSPILITDVAVDERFSGSESMKISGLRSAMCAPLVAEGRLFGVLYVDNLKRTAAFLQDELDVFAVVASQAAAAIDSALSHQQIARQALERAALERFLAPQVVELVARDPDKVRLGGVTQPVTILFADLRRFTALAETLDPERVVEVLNEYFTRATEIIFEFGGTLDKYLGDGLMALFGAPLSKGNDAKQAVRAALKIQAMMTELNRDARTRGWPELRVGAAVNSGVVTAGNIGSPRRLDYTVIGDAVNVASRLCSHAIGGQVLVSQSTANDLGSEFKLTKLEPLLVRGKSIPVSVYAVAPEASKVSNVSKLRSKGKTNTKTSGRG